MFLQRLGEYNPKLKPSKCCVLQKQLVFLGHVVSGDVLATDPAKTQLVRDWPVPENLRQLRGFLGLATYYRKFVKSYADIAATLNRLLCKNQHFDWTQECQTAFEQLKNALITSPVLALPNDSDPFVLDTDASDESIICVLSQVQNSEEKIVAFAGPTLSKIERNYCVSRNELLAVVYFTKYFRQYLLGQKFTIRTDHAALQWLNKTPNPVGQNARWLEILGEYDFEIKHRRGASHGNADTISRHPCLRKPSCTACHPAHNETEGLHCASVKQMSTQDDPGAIDMLCWSPDDLPAAQRSDPDIGFVMAMLESSPHKPTWDQIAAQSADVKSLCNEWERLQIHGNILCRKWAMLDGTPDRWQVVLPVCYRSEFIKLAHSGATGGHAGRSKTQHQVQLRAYWPGWRMDDALEVQKCTSCAQYHRGKAPKQTPLKPFLAGEPFETLSLNITGKHPKSRRGNEYIVIVVDHFSKWADAFAVRSHKAPIVAKILVDHVFSRYGMPKRLLSDQAPEFESELFTELCRRLEIDKIHTSAYQPSTNACCERFHRSLNAMLGKMVLENQSNWDDCLPTVLAAYSAAKHESTGQSPNMLVFCGENRAPLDIALGCPAEEQQHYDSYVEYVSDLRQRQRKLYALARKHLNAAAERRKRDYDAKVKPMTFAIGQWVWYFCSRRYVKRTPKWCRNYHGPFLVTAVIEPNDYVIQRSRRFKLQVVHGDKLKLFRGPAPKSWLKHQ